MRWASPPLVLLSLVDLSNASRKEPPSQLSRGIAAARRLLPIRSLQDAQTDNSTATSELRLHLYSSLAQFKRRHIEERTTAGLTTVSPHGRLRGRLPFAGADTWIQAAKRLNQDCSLGINEICKTLGLSRPTFYHYLALANGVRKD